MKSSRINGFGELAEIKRAVYEANELGEKFEDNPYFNVRIKGLNFKVKAASAFSIKNIFEGYGLYDLQIEFDK